MGIDHAAGEYLYRQLAGILREQITSGQLAGRIPAFDALAAEYGVAEMTVRSAIKLLRDEGLVATYPGRGTFVV